AVEFSGDHLKNVAGTGVLVDTIAPTWATNNAFVTLSNVTVTLASGATGIRVAQQATTPGYAAQVTLLGNSAISGGATGVLVSGANASSTLISASLKGNGVGLEVDAGKALVQDSDLSNNSVAGIRVLNGGTVDAGDCAGSNVTGLGTGSGSNGSSAGRNNLAGYGFDGSAPWAITNAGSVLVKAYQNLFGAVAGDKIALALSGEVNFSQAGGGPISCWAIPGVQFLEEVPAAVDILEEFVAAGGIAPSSSATVTSEDVIVTNYPGHYIVTRTYTLIDICGETGTCDQVIEVDDPVPFIVAQPANVRADLVGTAAFRVTTLGSPPLSYQWFQDGIEVIDATNATLVIPVVHDNDAGAYQVVVTNAFGAVTSAVATLSISHPPVITVQPVSVTAQWGQSATFMASVNGTTPFTYQWLKNGEAISGQTTRRLTLGNLTTAANGSYTVAVTNADGFTISAPATLTVLILPGKCSIKSCEPGAVSLLVTGTAGYKYAVLSTTNFVDWIAVATNIAPFTCSHPAPGSLRFYRTQFLPE
ncbi:MAG TPA: immunoglobulin domain-containing protein, partial [Clostridia bacterium]|nr:immunoglobulin domain-containing protein [Clostridia bacterium]